MSDAFNILSDDFQRVLNSDVIIERIEKKKDRVFEEQERKFFHDFRQSLGKIHSPSSFEGSSKQFIKIKFNVIVD